MTRVTITTTYRGHKLSITYHPDYDTRTTDVLSVSLLTRHGSRDITALIYGPDRWTRSTYALMDAVEAAAIDDHTDRMRHGYDEPADPEDYYPEYAL